MHDFADIYDFLIIRRVQWFQTPIAPKRVTSFQSIFLFPPEGANEEDGSAAGLLNEVNERTVAMEIDIIVLRR